jgi:hypothetical protein
MRLDVLRERAPTGSNEEEIIGLVAHLGDYTDAGMIEAAWQIASIPSRRGDGLIERLAQGAGKSKESIRLLRRLGEHFTPDVILNPDRETLFSLLTISHLMAVLPEANRSGLDVALTWLERAAFGDAEAEKDGINPVWSIAYLKRRIALVNNPDRPQPVHIAGEVFPADTDGYYVLLVPVEGLNKAGIMPGAMVVGNIRSARL